MPLLRASSLDLFWGCSAWVGVEPDVKVDVDKQFPNAKASRDWGTMVHTWKETGKVVHPERNLREEKLLAKRIKKHGLRPQQYWPDGGWHEVSVAYNWVFGVGIVEYAAGESFRERFDDEWITGKIDYFREDEPGGIDTVDDLKTGKWWDKTPTECVQTTFYGLALYRAGLTNNKLSTITHWPKYPASAPPTVIPDVITRSMYEAFEKKLVRKLSVIGQSQYNPSESNCRFCPNRLSCPSVWRDDGEV